ncbi:MAG: YggT family protein [Clostridiales bacterium]|jgi:YggT family protein|nr:YggT family protein [Eubacteriales bacterium]MDH7565212.1 YggT family protein [Clostridiales bacterium]
MYLLPKAIVGVLELIEIAIVIRAVISWFPISGDNAFVKILNQITEPVLSPIRGIINRSSVGRNIVVDFSPIIAFFLIELVIRIIAGALRVQPFIF